jgi:hypothetical protein
MPQFLKYFPLVKVDESTHTISGIATAEVPDKDGEIADYKWCKTKAYPAWSKEASESTKAAGQEVSYGNIRVQHTLEIGGKVKAPPVFDDIEKSIHIDTEPENESIWTKARKGFIRGFSHAGDYAWRKCNQCFQKDEMEATDIPEGRECPKCKKTVFVRYGPILAEVSYVDNPCLKQATFSLVKADGTTELKKFTEGSSAMELNKQAGTPADEPAKTQAVDIAALTAQITKSVMEKLGKAVKHLVVEKNGATHLPYTDEDGTPNHRLMCAAWAALHGGYRAKKYAGPDKDKALEKLKALYEKEGLDTPDAKAKKVMSGLLAKAAEKKGVEKGLYEVSRFASLLQDLAYLRISAVYERDSEGDESALPEDLLQDLEALAETFLAMAEEETKELTAIAGEKGRMNMSTTPNALQKAKSSLAEHIQKTKASVSGLLECFDEMHKAVVEPKPEDAGAKNEPEPCDPQKEGSPGSMKAADGTFTKAQVDELIEKTVNETVQALVKALAADDDEEEEKPAKEKKKTEKASGIGDRGQLPVIMANGGPAIKVVPVTKAQDTQAAPAAAETPLTQADINKALSGDPTAALKFMKGVQSENGVPATVAGALSAVRR